MKRKPILAMMTAILFLVASTCVAFIAGISHKEKLNQDLGIYTLTEIISIRNAKVIDPNDLIPVVMATYIKDKANDISYSNARDRYFTASRGNIGREAVEKETESTSTTTVASVDNPKPSATVAPTPVNTVSNETVLVESSGEVSDQQLEIVAYAKKFIGTQYIMGGTSPSGFDCSGLVFYVYKQFGYSLNRVAADQMRNGVEVSRSNLQPGDLIFFRGSDGGIGHVGMYVGDNSFIHSVQTGTPVTITNLNSSYYSARYVSARRIVK